MAYLKSSQKDDWKEISQKRSDRAKAMWANRKISEGVAKKLLKPPTRRKSKLFYYIGYIYLPIGFLVLMPAFAFLDQRVVLGATMLYGAGGIGLMYLDDKLTERKNAENKNV